ncbi:hypothetical protein A6D6_02678 [Alcanivorax xiamenensis]|uniref:Antitermination protein n=2 Tax=Alcanivorax xiamenensis TaxID=1177156 RepID=A0ABQ6Y6D4_9GAMM|nr:hypothetical protein A6D6_02678 [Alcanivorax xiamenensis]
MMGRLNVRGQSYAMPGSGHGDTVPFESLVAGALGMGRLHRGAELVGLVIYARHHDVARELVTRLAAAGSALFERKGWKTVYCYGIAEMLVFELLWPRRCVDCKGDGEYSVRYTALGEQSVSRKKAHRCQRCNGTGRGDLSQREQARVSGIEQSRFIRTWAPRAHEMRLMMLGWEEDCLRHLVRHFDFSAEAG